MNIRMSIIKQLSQFSSGMVVRGLGPQYMFVIPMKVKLVSWEGMFY